MNTCIKIVILCLLFYIAISFISKGKYRQTETECLESVYKTAFFGQSDYFCERCEPCEGNNSICDCPKGFEWKISQSRKIWISSNNCDFGILDSRGHCIEKLYLEKSRRNSTEMDLINVKTEENVIDLRSTSLPLVIILSNQNTNLLMLALCGLANSLVIMMAIFAIVTFNALKKPKPNYSSNKLQNVV